MTNCRETVDLLMDYVESYLSAQQRAAVEAHLAHCPRCVEFLSSYRALFEIVRRATEFEMPVPVQVRLRARIGGALGRNH
jgi:anti-sigma factor RsiW